MLLSKLSLCEKFVAIFSSHIYVVLVQWKPSSTMKCEMKKVLFWLFLATFELNKVVSQNSEMNFLYHVSSSTEDLAKLLKFERDLLLSLRPKQSQIVAEYINELDYR